MDNKFNNLLKDFIAKCDAENEEELNKAMQDFCVKYNTGEFDCVNSIMDDAYELLEQAQYVKTKKQAYKLAKEAYEMCPDCFDAVIFMANLEDSSLKRHKLLDEGLEFEKNRLEEEGFFEKDNIGVFYNIFETRPYIRGLYCKAEYLIFDGKIKQARDICLEILKLNENDNIGARYLLMAIYAYLEDEEKMLKLYNMYPEESLHMLFPKFVLYYKLGNDKEAKKILNKINKVNPYFIKFFDKTIRKNNKSLDGYYVVGDSSEVFMCFEQFSFLNLTLVNINEFILKYSKKNNRKED